MWRFIVWVQFSQIFYYSHACYTCYKCDAETSSQHVLLYSDNEFGGHCFSSKSIEHPEYTTSCQSQCLTVISFGYSKQNTEVKFDRLKSDKVKIKRSCLPKIVFKNRKSKCHWKRIGSTYNIECSSYCSSDNCNTIELHRDIIESQLEILIPTCRTCKTQIVSKYKSLQDSCADIEGKTNAFDLCFGMCYFVVHESADGIMNYKRGCISDFNGHNSLTGTYMVQGTWNYKLCHSTITNICNKDLKLDNSFKKIDSSLQRSRICLSCRSLKREQDQDTYCDNGEIETMFNIEKCTSRCISFVIIVADTVQTVRGCEDSLNLKFRGHEGNLVSVPSLNNNQEYGCQGCLEDYVEDVNYTYYHKDFLIIPAKSVDECKFNCTLMGRDNCIAFMYIRGQCFYINSNPISDQYKFQYRPIKTYVRNRMSRSTCAYYCYKTCRPQVNPCNNLDKGILQDSWKRGVADVTDFYHFVGRKSYRSSNVKFHLGTDTDIMVPESIDPKQLKQYKMDIPNVSVHPDLLIRCARRCRQGPGGSLWNIKDLEEPEYKTSERKKKTHSMASNPKIDDHMDNDGTSGKQKFTSVKDIFQNLKDEGEVKPILNGHSEMPNGDMNVPRVMINSHLESSDDEMPGDLLEAQKWKKKYPNRMRPSITTMHSENAKQRYKTSLEAFDQQLLNNNSTLKRDTSFKGNPDKFKLLSEQFKDKLKKSTMLPLGEGPRIQYGKNLFDEPNDLEDGPHINFGKNLNDEPIDKETAPRIKFDNSISEEEDSKNKKIHAKKYKEQNPKQNQDSPSEDGDSQNKNTLKNEGAKDSPNEDEDSSDESQVIRSDSIEFSKTNNNKPREEVNNKQLSKKMSDAYDVDATHQLTIDNLEKLAENYINDGSQLSSIYGKTSGETEDKTELVINYDENDELMPASSRISATNSQTSLVEIANSNSKAIVSSGDDISRKSIESSKPTRKMSKQRPWKRFGSLKSRIGKMSKYRKYGILSVLGALVVVSSTLIPLAMQTQSNNALFIVPVYYNDSENNIMNETEMGAATIETTTITTITTTTEEEDIETAVIEDKTINQGSVDIKDKNVIHSDRDDEDDDYPINLVFMLLAGISVLVASLLIYAFFAIYNSNSIYISGSKPKEESVHTVVSEGEEKEPEPEPEATNYYIF